MYNQKYHQFTNFYNHKFGFHINGPVQAAFETALQIKPKIVKTLDFSVEPMRQIRQQIPDVFLIGRLFVDPQDFGQLSGRTAQAARQQGQAMAEKILQLEVNREINHFNGQPLFHAWESLNEVLPEAAPDDLHKLYDEYQVAFIERMRAAGFEAIAMNFGTGNGRGQQWLNLYPGTLEQYKYLGFHEYDWPTMNRLHQIGLEQGNSGQWLALRYRRIMIADGIRQKYGNQHICIITECGMTQGVLGGQDVGPWAENTIPPEKPESQVISPLAADAYWETLRWYNAQLMEDDYVMGACLFVTGASGKPEWATFEHLGPIMERLGAFQQVVDFEPPPPASDSHMYGLNIDPANPEGTPSATQLQTLGVQTVRYSFKDNSTTDQLSRAAVQQYQAKLEEYAAANISSLIILTDETLPANPAPDAPDAEWDRYISRFAQRAGQLAQTLQPWQPAFQIWNEPDLLEATPTYNPTLRPAVFARMLTQCAQAIKTIDPDLRVISGGLVSGQPTWLQQVLNALGGALPVDGVALHPYLQRPDPNWPDPTWGVGYVGTLLDGYRQVTQLPLWISESGTDQESLQAEYLRRMYNTINNQYSAVVPRLYWFCYADGMVSPYGLLNETGQPKPAYEAYRTMPKDTGSIRRYGMQFISHNTPEVLVMSQTALATITLRNTSSWTWPSAGANRVKLGQRWRTTDGRELPSVLLSDTRTPLPFDVAPGQSVTLNAELTPPRALGPFVLQWDLVEELQTWFSAEGAEPLAVSVEVNSHTVKDPSRAWTVSASHHNERSGPDNLLQAIDGNLATRWSTEAVQRPGMWFQIDLGRAEIISQIKLDNTDSPLDYPRGYIVQLSTDGQNWTNVAANLNNNGPLNATFTPQTARYIRVEQTGSSDRWWWSIHEVEINAMVQPTVRASHNNLLTGRDALSNVLDEDSFTRWSSRAVQQPGMWFQIDLNEAKLVRGLKLDNTHSPHEYPRGYIVRLSTDGQQWTEVARNPNNNSALTVSFTELLARYLRVEQTGRSNRWWWAIHGFTVVDRQISLSAAASHNNRIVGPNNLLHAFDGELENRWSSNMPQKTGMWFEVDLNRVRTVNGLYLDTARTPSDYPRGYRVKLSQDHRSWETVAHNPANTGEVNIGFTPRPARYLRVELIADAPQPWSIHEVVVKFGGGELAARASHNNARVGLDNLTQAFDGHLATRWSTRQAQQPGMWFEIDLGEIRPISGLALDNSQSPRDYPRGYLVLASEDGEQWQRVARRTPNTGPVDIDFAPRPVRYLRVIQIGRSRLWWWSIHEVVIKEA